MTPLTWWNAARGRASEVNQCLHWKKTKEAEWSGPTSHDLTRNRTARAGAQASVTRNPVPEVPANAMEGMFADEMPDSSETGVDTLGCRTSNTTSSATQRETL